MSRGRCKYCGQSCGIFSNAHRECTEKHKRGIAELLAYINSYFEGQDNISTLFSMKKTVENNNYLTMENVAECCRRGLKHFAETLRLPITKQHLQLIASFLNNMGVSRSSLNKEGELDDVALRYHEGVLTSYFVENEPIDIVEKRLKIVEQLLPLSSSMKEKAALTVLDKAAQHFLRDGIITDGEQRQLDEYSQAFNLSTSNLPQEFNGENLIKVQQVSIIRDLQNGKTPQLQRCSVPILLTSGEYVIWEYKGVTLYQEKTTREWVGRNSGWSFRVTKGVYYHTGGSKGHPIEHTSLEPQGIGSLILTNKNIIFFSPQRSAKTPYKKLIGITPYSDGVELQKVGTNTKREIYQGFDCWFLMNLISYIK